MRIPIDRSYYEEEQIDNEAILPIQKTVTYEVTQVEAANEVEEVAEKANSILLVEDNEELLQLMTKLLNRDYNVFTAENGKEGITVLRMRILT